MFVPFPSRRQHAERKRRRNGDGSTALSLFVCFLPFPFLFSFKLVEGSRSIISVLTCIRLFSPILCWKLFVFSSLSFFPSQLLLRSDSLLLLLLIFLSHFENYVRDRCMRWLVLNFLCFECPAVRFRILWVFFSLLPP